MKEAVFQDFPKEYSFFKNIMTGLFHVMSRSLKSMKGYKIFSYGTRFRVY